MNPTSAIVLCTIGLFVAVIACQEFGSRLALSSKREGSDASAGSIGPAEGAASAFLGLMLAFAFSASAGRMEARRDLAVNEANAIGTAYLRLDLLPEQTQPVLKSLFADYVGLRIESNSALESGLSMEPFDRRTAELQSKIWKDGVAAAQSDSTAPPKQLLIPALNEMFDLAAARKVAIDTHQPALITVVLLVFVLFAAVSAGRANPDHATGGWARRLLFAGLLSITFFALADLEFPRAGLIRIDYADQLLRDLQTSMLAK